MESPFCFVMGYDVCGGVGFGDGCRPVLRGMSDNEGWSWVSGAPKTSNEMNINFVA